MNKLEGLPKIYYINLVEATERNQHMLNMFDKYNITNFERYEATRHAKSGHKRLSAAEFGCMISHIEVCKLIAAGDDEYAIVFEDDIDLSGIDKWQFTWNDFISKMPRFDILQIHRHQVKGFDRFKLKKWEVFDHSTAGYVITKSYARGIVSLYERNKSSLSGFKSLSKAVGPVADFSMFYHGNAYSSCILNVVDLPSQIVVHKGPVIEEAYKLIYEMFENDFSIDDIIK